MWLGSGVAVAVVWACSCSCSCSSPSLGTSICRGGGPEEKKKKNKNPIALAGVAAEAWVPSPARYGGLKDPVLPQLWLGCSPWPGNLHMLRVWP